jgi:hypothetical protein
MCNTVITFNPVYPQILIPVANKSNLNEEQLKQRILTSEERSLTIQFERTIEYLAFAQSLMNDQLRVMVVDVAILLKEYHTNKDRVSAWSVLLEPALQEFLYHPGLSTQQDTCICELSELDQLRLHIAKRLSENIKIIVLLNPSQGSTTFYKLISDVERYLPDVKIVVLDRSIVAVTEWVWQVDDEGKVSKLENVW